MPMSSADFIRDAWYDLGCIGLGQTCTDDVFQAGLKSLNEMLDAWSGDRLFVYIGIAPAFTILPQFPDLTTAYSFATGYPRCIRKNLALELADMSRSYLKIGEMNLQKLTSDAAASRQSVEGQGPQ